MFKLLKRRGIRDLFALKDQPLLIRGGAVRVEDLLLHVLDRVGPRDIHGDDRTRHRLDVDLPAAARR